MKYRRDPSNPTGDCVKVDVKCTDSLDDGRCFKCKEGSVPGWGGDGLCYDISPITPWEKMS